MHSYMPLHDSNVMSSEGNATSYAFQKFVSTYEKLKITKFVVGKIYVILKASFWKRVASLAILQLHT